MSRATVWPLLLAAATLGCQRPIAVPTQYYAVVSSPSVQAAQPTGLKLAVRPFDAVTIYRDRVAYRSADHVLTYYDKAQWAEPVAATVTRAIADGLLESGAFADVGSSLDMGRPELILLGEVRRYDEDRTGATPEAVCEVQLELREGSERALVWVGTVSARAPMPGSGPRALAGAMSQALTHAVEQAVPQIINATRQTTPAT